MSSDDGKIREGTGLSHSTPLVTIASPPAIAHGIAVPAGNNHPLAAMAPVSAGATSEGNANEIGSDHNISSVSASATVPMISKNLSPPFAPPPVSTPNRPVASSPLLSARVVPASVSPTKSLESLADQFLSAPSFRTENLGMPPLVRPTPLPQEDAMNRLRTLVERRAWGDVLKVTTTMLAEPDPHSSVYSSLVEWPAANSKVEPSSFSPQLQEETVEILSLRCHAILKLRRYSDLTSEVERWNFVTHNDATAESPAWLPWSLHIIAAQTQQFSEYPISSSDVLYSLRERIPIEQPVWITSVNNALANTFLRQGEWRLALGSLDQILELIPSASKYEVETKFNFSDEQMALSVLIAAYSCEVLSRQGRALLQVGALPEAEERFGRAKMNWINATQASGTMSPELERVSIVQIVPPLLDVNQGLLHFANGNCEQALESFKRATDQLRKQDMLCPKYRVDDWIGPTIAAPRPRDALYTECINNMGLCALYTCRMHEAVQLMEGLVREDPTAFLSERLAFNLCTLYELGYDSAASARKKRVLQLIGKRFFLHDVGPESFRVT